MVDPELPASSSAAGSLQCDPLNRDDLFVAFTAPFDLRAQRLHAAERRLAIGAGRIIGDGAFAFGNRREHGVAVGNRFIAGQGDDAFNRPRGRDRFFHEISVKQCRRRWRR